MNRIHLVILLLSAVQAGIAAALGFQGQILSDTWKLALVVLAAMIAIILNQLPAIGKDQAA